MSTHVVTRLHAKPGRGDDVESWPGAPRAGSPTRSGAMLTEPLVINYYDEVFYSPGVAAAPSVPAAGA